MLDGTRCRPTGPRKGNQMKLGYAASAIAVLALAACGGQTKPAAETSQVSTQASTQVSTQVSTAAGSSSSATASPAAAPGKGDKPSRDFVIGKWGTDGDCTLAIDLRPDGTSDGPFGNWSYSDGVLSFPDEPSFKINVTVIDDATMQSTNGDGKTAKMTRCP